MQVNDLVTNLRGLSRGDNSDFSLGDESADEIERLRAENFELSAGACLHGIIGGEHGHPTCPEIERLRWELANAQGRIQRLEAVFAHYHVRSPEDDACAECGLDLRDPVHLRVDDERLKGPKAASRTATPAAEGAGHG